MISDRSEKMQNSAMLVNLDAEEHIDEKSVSSLSKTAPMAQTAGSGNENYEHEYSSVPASTEGIDGDGSDSRAKATTETSMPVPDAPLVTTAAAATDPALTLKMKEERKKEREKKKEEELMKKYMAEQEAKQKVIAVSKCGRWLKNSIKIGEGGYKFVYRGYDREEARTVAWCEFKHEHVDTKEKRQIMFRETEIMLKMNHPHIVQCFDVFREWTNEETAENPLEEKGLVIIQELMSGGTLKQVIRKNYLDGQCILRFQLLTRWWHQIVDALRYMHHQLETPIIHRDLKSENCFLYGYSNEEYLNVKVGDFGLATQVGSSGRKTMLGTVGFMAPEIFDEMYDEKVDIYAFGMLMLEVMTNRTPYDECATLFDAAAKTMSGHGPEIMQLITNSNLAVLISACIHPLACFRPTAEELYCHPLFQMNVVKTAACSLQPKTIPVEVEPNYETGADRKEVLERFVRSLANPETRNPRFNLRLRFRDRKILQELGLDEGESLEFDLDIYKAENQDIPDLITNLRRDYEDKLSRVFANPKLTDRKIISNHLDRLFNSIRMQMQFLVKCLLGRRWKDILDSLATKEKPLKEKPTTQEGQDCKAEGLTADSEEETDTDIVGCSNFEIIAKCKSKWLKAKRMLDREIQAYRKAAAFAASSVALQIGDAAQKPQQQMQPQASNSLASPQPMVPRGTPSPAILNASEGVSHGITPPPLSANLVADPSSNGVEDTSAASQAPSTPIFFPSAALQQAYLACSFQDYSNIQSGSPTALTQGLPSMNPPTIPQPQVQAVPLRIPAQTVSLASQQQHSLSNSSVICQVLPNAPQHIPRDFPTNLGSVGGSPTILQSVQPSTAVSFPAPSALTNSMPVGLTEHQPTSATGGLTYFAQQPPLHYPTAGLPPNLTLQQPLQQQQRIDEEKIHEREVISDTEIGAQAGGPGAGLLESLIVPAGLGGPVTGYATVPTSHPVNQQLTSIASSPTLITKAAEQRVAPPVGAKPKRKVSQPKPIVSQQPLRYIIRITRLEHESEGCDVPGTLRPTFYLEMPDINNPNSELWKLSFRCNLSDTTDDIKLFEGCGYTKTNEEVDRAIKEAVAMMLRALQADEKAIPLNHDYVFYPQLSPELISISGYGAPPETAPTGTTKEEVGRPPSLPTAIADSTAAFGSPHDVYLSDTTPSAESPVERGLQTGFTGVTGVQSNPDCSFPTNISPYVNQVVSASSYMGYPGLEEVPPVFAMGQPERVYPSKPVSLFPANIDPSHFYASEPGNTYDSTDSLPICVNGAYPHPVGQPPKGPDVFTTLKVPAHAQSLIAQFAHHLCTYNRNDPLLIVPSDTNTTGYMSVLSENCSFFCSRNGVDGGFSVMPIPPSSSFLEVQNKSAPALQGKVLRTPHNAFTVVTPDGEMHQVERPLIILPANTQRPLVELPLLSADGSSVQLDDILTLLINLREGMANSTTSVPFPRGLSATGSALGSTHSQIRQQDANYYSLPCGAAPINSARKPMQGPPPLPATAASTRQMGFRPPPPIQQLPMRVASDGSPSISHGDLSVTTLATHAPPAPPPDYVSARPPTQNLRQSQQQLLASALATSGSKADQAPQQAHPNIDYLATLFSANPSLFLATAAALSVNNSTNSQEVSASLSSLQPPPMVPLWNNSTTLPSNPPAAPTTSLSNADAVKQLFMRAALEGTCPQQQLPQPLPSVGPNPIPTMATMTTSARPGFFPSTEAYDPNAAHGQPVLPTPTTLFQPNRPPQPAVAVSQPFVSIGTGQSQIFHQQQHPMSTVVPPPCSGGETTTTSVVYQGVVKKPSIPPSVPQAQPALVAGAANVSPISHNKPPLTVAAVASRFVVTSAASVTSSQVLREAVPTSSLMSAPPPPPPLPSPSPQGATVVGNRFTVVSLDSGAVQPNPADISYSSIPPAPPVPQQMAPTGPGVQKKIPPKFTVSSEESEATLCTGCSLLPSSISNATSTLIPANVNGSVPTTTTTLRTVLRSSPPSENDLPSECPPPPSTPAMSNQSLIVETALPYDNPSLLVHPSPHHSLLLAAGMSSLH